MYHIPTCDVLDKDDQNTKSGGAMEACYLSQSLEQQYTSAMKDLQFDTFEMVQEEGRSLKFLSSHHYESNVKAAGTVNNVARTRRLAQEAVTLSTSLPLAFSSSVFVRCDEERLDIMKVNFHFKIGVDFIFSVVTFHQFFIYNFIFETLVPTGCMILV